MKNLRTSDPIIDRLLENDDYHGLLAYLNQLEENRSLTSAELVWRSRALQLDETPYEGPDKTLPLVEAELALKQALELDDGDPEILNDLGFFYYAVEDDYRRAMPLFEKAVEISQRLLGESVSGMAKCIEEANSAKAAGRFAQKAIATSTLAKTLDPEVRGWIPKNRRARVKPTS
jgi:tetratricopeptide (TPR) repeat protein